MIPRYGVAGQLGQSSPAPRGASPTSSASRRIRRADVIRQPGPRPPVIATPPPGPAGTAARRPLDGSASSGSVGAEQVAGLVGPARRDRPQPQTARGEEQSRRQTLVRAAGPARGVRKRVRERKRCATPKPSSAATMGSAASPTPRAPNASARASARHSASTTTDRRASAAAAHPVPAGEQHAVEVVERRLGHRGPEQRELHSRSLADRHHCVDGHPLGGQLPHRRQWHRLEAPGRSAPVPGLLGRAGRTVGLKRPGLRRLGRRDRVLGRTSPIEILRRLDTMTAATMIANATTAITARSGVEACRRRLSLTTAGATSTATRFITLISGLIAGRRCP